MPGAPITLPRSPSREEKASREALKPFQKRRIPFHTIFWLIVVLLSGAMLFQHFNSITLPVNFGGTYPFFVDREDILAELKHRLLKRSKSIDKVVLWGEGGVGKSEIAIKFANECLNKFSFIYWTNASSSEALLKSYFDLAHELKIPFDHKIAFEKLQRKVHAHLEKMKHGKPWLLIYDNVEKGLEFPRFGRGKILITTKERSFWDTNDCIEVPVFSQEAAKLLYAKIMKEEEVEEWGELAEELGYLPLALNQTLHYVRESPNLSIADYRLLIRENRRDFFKSKIGDLPYKDHLITMWALNAVDVRTKHPRAYALLEICAYLHPDQIPLHCVEEWLMKQEGLSSHLAKLEANEILRVLIDRGIIRVNKEKSYFSLHRLKQKLIQHEHAYSFEARKKALHFLVDLWKEYESVWKLFYANKEFYQHFSDWEVCANWWLNHHSEGFSDSRELALLFNLLGNNNLIYKGKELEALSQYQRALDVQNKLYPDQVYTLWNLAFCSSLEGKHPEAEALYHQTLDCITQIASHPTPLEMAECWKGLGLNYYWQCSIRESLEAFEKAERIVELWTGLEADRILAEIKKWKGIVLGIKEENQQCLQYLLESYEMNQKMSSEPTFEKCYILSHIGKVYRKLGDFQQALSYDMDVLKKCEELNLNSSIHVVYLKNVAIDYRKLKKYKKSIDYSEKALKFASNNIDNGLHPRCILPLINLGDVYLELDLINKALNYYLESYAKLSKIYGGKVSGRYFYFCFRGLGRAYVKLGDFEKGAYYLEDALNYKLNIFGAPRDHSSLLEILEPLAKAYVSRDPIKAREYLSWIESVKSKEACSSSD